MKLEPSPRQGWSHYAQSLGFLALALLLAGLSVQGLWRSYSLQIQLNESFTVQQVRNRALAALMQPTLAALDSSLSDMLTERWGLTQLTVTNANNQVLASVSIQQSGLSQLVSTLLTSQLLHTHGLLALESSGPSPAAGGTLEYRLRPAISPLVHDSAVASLRSYSLLGSVIALLLGGLGLSMLMRRSQQGEQPPPPNVASPVLPLPHSPSPLDGTAELLDNLEVAMVLVSNDLRIISLNQTASQMSGWSPPDAMGQLLYTVFHCRDESGAPVVSPGERAVRDRCYVKPIEVRIKPRGESANDRQVEAWATPHALADGSSGSLMLVVDIRSRAITREEYRSKARLSETVIDQLVEGVFTTDTHGVVKSANTAAQRLFGYSGQELTRLTVSRLLPVPFMNAQGVKLTDYATAPGVQTRLPKVVGWRKDATTFPAELLVKAIRLDNELRYLLLISDISPRLRSQSLAQRLGRLLDQSSDEIYIFDAQTLYFTEVNSGARHNLGLTAEELTHHTPLNIAQGLDPAVLEGHLNRLRGGEAEQITYKARHLRRDGSSYPVEVRLSFSREEEPPVFMAIAQDITDREAADKRMRQLAHYDTLTGLPNRTLLFDRLKQAMISAQRSKRILGVYFLDLNGFKPINDTYGHDVGDLVLKQVAQRLSSALRADDTVARLGGDEFVVLAPGVNDLSDINALAWKLMERFEEPFDLPAQPVHLSTSIGITVFPQDSSDAEGLLRHADSAMYESKVANNGKFHFYQAVNSPSQAPSAETRRNLVSEIRSALTEQHFRSQFLPIFASNGQSLMAVEADFYWQHPLHGRVSSSETLYAAKRMGLNTLIEDWLLEQVIQSYTSGQQLGIPAIPTLVNITARQWHDTEFAERLAQKIRAAQAPGAALILCLSADDWLEAEAPIQMLWLRLLDLGVKLAVREPAHLASLEAIAVVILPATIAPRVMEDPSTVQRVRDWVSSGRTVIAEGVSTRKEQERLTMLGVSGVCGPYLGVSQSPQEFAHWFGARQVSGL